MFLVLLLLFPLSLLLPNASSFPVEQEDWGPNQNQLLLDNIYTYTAAVAVPNDLGSSLGTPDSQDPLAWWNQNQNQKDVKPAGEGSDNTGHSSSFSSFDATSSSERPNTADTAFLLASTQATNSNGGGASDSLLLPPSPNNPNSVLDRSIPLSSSDMAFSSTTTDDFNPSSLALSPNMEDGEEEVKPETRPAGSSSTILSSLGSSILETSNPSGEGQQMALIGDEGDVGFPLDLPPVLGGEAPVIDLPAILTPIFNPKIPQPLSFPIRYNDKDRLDDPQTPDCDEGMFPFCCNLGPPEPADYIKNAHKRRDCRTFDPMWEGCHWRQNMFCCKCADRSTKVRVGIGCYNVWYRGNPFYDQKRLPKPVKLANPKIDQPQQSGGEGGNAQELPGETAEITKRPSNLPGTGKAFADSCSKKQLDHWRETHYI